MSKENDTLHQVQFVTTTSDFEPIINLTTAGTGNPLPDSRYITLINQNHPLEVVEIQVYGGEIK